jgi:small subunit ribosomal protein S4
LDNVVYRLGIAPTRRAARQLVTHCHITVNGEVLNIPSYSVTLNDEIAVRERSKSLEVVSNSLGSNRADQYPWMQWNAATMSGKMLSVPSRDMIPENIKEQLIVELYSK